MENSIYRPLLRANENTTREQDIEYGDKFYYGKEYPMNKANAVMHYKSAAAKGSLYAYLMLGYMYENGDGIPANPRDAVYFYSVASENGIADATLNLANMYLMGHGITIDERKGNELLYKAAEQGSGMAASSLGRNYTLGIGVEKSLTNASFWINKAEQLGYINSDTMNDLGCMYENHKMNREAFSCFEKAIKADPKNPNALFMIGKAYFLGKGVAIDIDQSERYIRQYNAIEAGDEDALRIINGIKQYRLFMQSLYSAYSLFLNECKGIGEFYYHFDIRTENKPYAFAFATFDRYIPEIGDSYFNNPSWEVFSHFHKEKEIKRLPSDVLFQEECQYYCRVDDMLTISPEQTFHYFLNALQKKYPNLTQDNGFKANRGFVNVRIENNGVTITNR